jgi:nucleotide-binding universal stress UspA family protein
VRLRDGQRATASSAVPVSAGRPVILLTFDVPVTAEAAELAVDAAVESGQPLIVVNAVELSIRPMTASWGTGVVVAADVDESLRAPAELARALAVEVERIRLVSPRPVAAVLELVAERLPGLLVIGPDRRRMSGRRLARAEKRIREAAPCLVWTGRELGLD